MVSLIRNIFRKKLKFCWTSKCNANFEYLKPLKAYALENTQHKSNLVARVDCDASRAKLEVRFKIEHTGGGKQFWLLCSLST